MRSLSLSRPRHDPPPPPPLHLPVGGTGGAVSIGEFGFAHHGVCKIMPFDEFGFTHHDALALTMRRIEREAGVSSVYPSASSPILQSLSLPFSSTSSPSKWVMMHKLRRRLSKIHEEVRAERGPYFVEHA